MAVDLAYCLGLAPWIDTRPFAVRASACAKAVRGGVACEGFGTWAHIIAKQLPEQLPELLRLHKQARGALHTLQMFNADRHLGSLPACDTV